MRKKNILNTIHYSVWDGDRKVWIQQEHKHLAGYRLTSRGAQKIITKMLGKKPMFSGRGMVTSVESILLSKGA